MSATEPTPAAAPAVEYPEPFTPQLDTLLHIKRAVQHRVKVATIQQVAGCSVEEARLIGGCYGYKRDMSTEVCENRRLIDAGSLVRVRKCRVKMQPKLAEPALPGSEDDEEDDE